MPVSITTARATNLIPAVAVKRLLDEAADILPFDEVPLQNVLGSEPINNIKPEWLDDDLDKQTATVNAISALASATIVLVDSSNVRIGDVLKLQNGTVMAHVTNNVFGTNTLTVTRPFNGSTDQALAVNDILEIVGQNLTEGQDPAAPRDTDYTGDFNFTQIFQESVQATRTVRKNDSYGASDPYARAEMKKYRELNVRLERAYIHGKRMQSGATRQMGGLLEFVGANGASVPGGTYADTAANLFKFDGTGGANSLVRGLENAYNLGATPNLIVMSPRMKGTLSGKTYTGSVFEQPSDTGLGRVKDMLRTDFGDVEFVMSRFIPRQFGIVLTRELVRRLVFEPWFSEPLAKTGDTDKGEIVGEFSCKVKHADQAHFVIQATDL